MTDKQPSLAVGSIAIDPSNHSVIYVGTGEENFSADSYFGAGILKSINGGTSWTQIKGPFVGQFSLDGKYFFGGAAHIGAIAIEPGNSSVMLVAVEMSPDTNNLNFTDVYRTEDGGITWTSVLPISSNAPDYFKWGTAVLFDPNNGNIAYAAISGPFNSCTACSSGVYKSLDAGKTWIHIYGTGNNILPQTNLGRIALAIAPSNPNTIYAGIQDTSTFGLLGLFKTTDGGANWIKLANTPNYCVPQCWYDQAIAVAPNNPNVVFVGGAGGGGISLSIDQRRVELDKRYPGGEWFRSACRFTCVSLLGRQQCSLSRQRWRRLEGKPTHRYTRAMGRAQRCAGDHGVLLFAFNKPQRRCQQFWWNSGQRYPRVQRPVGMERCRLRRRRMDCHRSSYA